MKISIVTASFNSADTLRDTLDSVLRQDYPDFEHIVIDGGSTDETIDILREYEPRYQGRLIWRSEPDNGIYDGMNKGIQLSTGDVIGFLNSDDLYADKNILSLIVSSLADFDCTFGDLIYVDRKNINKEVRKWQGSEYKPCAFFSGWHPAHPTFYVKKAIIDKSGGFNTSLAISADFELMLRIFEKEKISSHYIPYILIKMRTGGESNGSIRKIIQGNINVIKAFRINGFKAPRFYLIKRLWPKFIKMVKTKFKTEI